MQYCQYNICTYIYAYVFMFRDSKLFEDTCERMKTSDDLTTGAIVGTANITLC